METSIEVGFGEGFKMTTTVGGHEIETDVPVKQGGGGGAPSPFDVFLASLASCSGVFAKRYLQSHGLDAAGLGISVSCEWHEKEYRVTKMTTRVALPPDFPEKHKAPLLRAMGQCAVKKQVLTPPEFALEIVE